MLIVIEWSSCSKDETDYESITKSFTAKIDDSMLNENFLNNIAFKTDINYVEESSIDEIPNFYIREESEAKDETDNNESSNNNNILNFNTMQNKYSLSKCK